jgi:hypothetical protein
MEMKTDVQIKNQVISTRENQAKNICVLYVKCLYISPVLPLEILSWVGCPKDG